MYKKLRNEFAGILTGKGDQRGLGFGCFNDNIRNAIRGSTDGTDGGGG